MYVFQASIMQSCPASQSDKMLSHVICNTSQLAQSFSFKNLKVF